MYNIYIYIYIYILKIYIYILDIYIYIKYIYIYILYFILFYIFIYICNLNSWKKCFSFFSGKYIFVLAYQLSSTFGLSRFSIYYIVLHCIYIYISYICYHENNVPFRLSPQWLCGNSCTWAHDNIYITLILLLRDLGTLCVVDHLWPLMTTWFQCNIC